LIPPIVAVVGWSNSGKTTLVARLVEELQRRGRRVGVVKHAEHPLKLGPVETDGARLAAAGASSVAVVGRDAVLRLDAFSSSLRAVAATMDVDVVLAEGFKRDPGLPKIEVRAEPDALPCVVDGERLALVRADCPDADLVDLADLLLGVIGSRGVVVS
jgi:molybdopterin-guanine dinucleotide biosynthesis protein B